MILETNELQELYNDLVDIPLTLSACKESPIELAFKKCDELLQEHMKKLQDRNDILKKSNDMLLSANTDLAIKNSKLQQDHDELKKDRDIWVRKNGEKQAEIAELKKKCDELKNESEYFEKNRNSWLARSKRYETVAEEHKKKLDFQQNTIDSLRKDRDRKDESIVKLVKKRDELQQEVDDLKTRLNSMFGEEYIQKLQNRVREIGYEEGQTDLWDMLQNVNDFQSFDFVTCFPNITGILDIFNWDLEDFLDCYKEWVENKEKERDLSKYSWHGDATAEKPKDTCDAFYDGLKAGLVSEAKESTASCDIPIKDLASWGCTIEATVEIDKDLLEKVCGVKPKEEHKLEYGDAVRVPWKDYDYMYIGPEDDYIVLFNPKKHYVTPVSSTKKFTYQGYKIIVCDEDDLRKIWNYKK